jgi:3-dehydroquinate synthase
MVLFFTDIIVLNTKLGDIIKSYSMVFVLCDENTEKYCLPLINPAIPDAHLINILSGEQYKNLKTCEDIWAGLTLANADRRSLLICLGGGVICDMGGFASSCYKRGIDFINIPTTLLAMVDASVGGKTGIDFNGLKNQIGVFSEATEVLICDRFLKTLDHRQIRSGMAEVFKHYLIADGGSFVDFDPNLSSPDIVLIQKAVAIKSAIVDADPLEKNVRKKLNFGHTIGHALESYSLSTSAPLLHGEAVAYGMAIEAYIALAKGLIDEQKATFICQKLADYFDLRPLPDMEIEQILSLVAQDKKNDKGIIKMSLIDDIGSCMIDIETSAEEIRNSIMKFNADIVK